MEMCIRDRVAGIHFPLVRATRRIASSFSNGSEPKKTCGSVTEPSGSTVQETRIVPLTSSSAAFSGYCIFCRINQNCAAEPPVYSGKVRSEPSDVYQRQDVETVSLTPLATLYATANPVTDIFTPVSYTHLDVYKRQPLRSYYPDAYDEYQGICPHFSV